LRNYISTLFQKNLLHGDDGGGGTIDVEATSAGGNAKELEENALKQIAFVEESNDPTHIYTWTVTRGELVTVYWQLDKTNVSIFADYLADFLYLAVITLQIPQMGIAKWKQDPDYSPRKGWKDDAGTKREPTPSDKGRKADFSGASGLFAAAQGLLAYSEALRESGRIRDAGIVKFAYDQIFNLTWSVTEAFDYLRKNGLV